jgi:hypothetical protein
MTGSQRLVAIAMTFLLTTRSGGATPDVVGIVVQASHASLGAHDAAEGTTLYDGDRLSTDADGALRLLMGPAALHLSEKSSVILHDRSTGGTKEFQAELLSGIAVLSVSATSGWEIVACSARVRPVSETRGIVRVQILGPQELLVYAQRGPALVSYRNETETIPEGKAYRVLLNASGDGGASANEAPKKPGKPNKALIILVAGALGAAAAAGLALAVSGGSTSPHGVESPDKP